MCGSLFMPWFKKREKSIKTVIVTLFFSTISQLFYNFSGTLEGKEGKIARCEK